MELNKGMKQIGLFLVCLCGCVGHTKIYELVEWSDGTNNCYAVELRIVGDARAGRLVLVPDVRFIHKNERFITGGASWRYRDGFYTGTFGLPNTNEFWFVLDKCRDFPKCYVFTSTNYHEWAAWCASNNAPTNLVDVNHYRETAPLYSGGGPRL